MSDSVGRRQFLKRSAGLVGGAAFLGTGAVTLLSGCPESAEGPPSAQAPKPSAATTTAAGGGVKGKVGSNRFAQHIGPDGCEMVRASMGDPAQGTDRVALVKQAIEAYGGIGSFVKTTDRVVIKPNVAWAQTPAIGANVHPDVVKALIELCKDAGAGEVIVGEHARDAWAAIEAMSKVAEVCKAAGAPLVSWEDERLYQRVDFALGESMTSDDVATDLLKCDVLINAAKFKHHSAAEVSGAMKNLMGVVLRPQDYHQTTDTMAKDPNLHVNIADLCSAVRPTLNVVDLTNTLVAGGPKGSGGAEVRDFHTVLVSTDIVACDALGTQILGICTIDQAAHIRIAGEERGLGKVKDFEVKQISV